MKTIIIMMRKDISRNFFKDFLIQNDKCVVFDTNDMSEGIRKCRELNPDLILIERDHFEPGKIYDPVTLKEIRKFNKEAIIVKASPNCSDGRWILETAKEGANGVIVFPTTPEIALETLRRYCPWL